MFLWNDNLPVELSVSLQLLNPGLQAPSNGGDLHTWSGAFSSSLLGQSSRPPPNGLVVP